MKPVIIIPTETISQKDKEALNTNGFCVVEADDPSKVKFLDPIPAALQRGKIETAAIQLSRILLHGQWGKISTSSQIGVSEIAKLFVGCLTEGTALDVRGSQEEREEFAFNQARIDESARLGREEARARRALKKAAEEKDSAKKDSKT